VPKDEAERRQRIMDTALRLAAVGGLEGLQIRDVVAKTGVSSATIYRYFASKEHLLVSAALARRAGSAGLAETPRPPSSARARIRDLLRGTTDALTRAPDLAVALIQALVCGQPEVSEMLIALRDELITDIANAIRPSGPTARDREVALAIQRVWFAAVVGWATGAEAPRSIDEAVESAVRLMISS